MIAVALLSHVCGKLTNDKAIMIPSIGNPASKQAAVLNTSFSLLESDINHHGGHKPTLSTKISAHDATVKISPLPFTGAESGADFAFGFSVENARLRKGLVRRPPNPDPRVMHLNLIDPGRQQLEIVCRFIENMNLGNADSEFFRTGEGLKFMGAFASALERQLKMFELMIEKNKSAYYHHTVYFFQLGLLLLAEIRKLA
jgi:hypothetical protein